MPKRIQRRRTKGWRMPEGAVYVGRPTKWGNPFNFAHVYDFWLTGRGIPYIAVFCPECGTNHVVTGAGMSVQVEQNMYDSFSDIAEARQAILKSIDELRGKDLACWCPLVNSSGCYVQCHADVLLSLANGITMEDVQRDNLRWAEREAVR